MSSSRRPGRPSARFPLRCSITPSALCLPRAASSSTILSCDSSLRFEVLHGITEEKSCSRDLSSSRDAPSAPRRKRPFSLRKGRSLSSLFQRQHSVRQNSGMLLSFDWYYSCRAVARYWIEILLLPIVTCIPFLGVSEGVGRGTWSIFVEIHVFFKLQTPGQMCLVCLWPSAFSQWNGASWACPNLLNKPECLKFLDSLCDPQAVSRDIRFVSLYTSGACMSHYHLCQQDQVGIFVLSL